MLREPESEGLSSCVARCTTDDRRATDVFHGGCRGESGLSRSQGFEAAQVRARIVVRVVGPHERVVAHTPPAHRASRRWRQLALHKRAEDRQKA